MEEKVFYSPAFDYSHLAEQGLPLRSPVPAWGNPLMYWWLIPWARNFGHGINIGRAVAGGVTQLVGATR